MRKKTAPMYFWTLEKTRDDVVRIARERNQSVASCLELAAMQFVARESRTFEPAKVNAPA